jgi:hypothetical protein
VSSAALVAEQSDAEGLPIVEITVCACWQRGATRTGSWPVGLHFRYANPGAMPDLNIGLDLAGRP